MKNMAPVRVIPSAATPETINRSEGVETTRSRNLRTIERAKILRRETIIKPPFLWKMVVLLSVSLVPSILGFALPPEGRFASAPKSEAGESICPLFVSASLRAPMSFGEMNGNNNEYDRDDDDDEEDSGSSDSAKQRIRRKYKRKRTIPETERHLFKLKQEWKRDYERIVRSAAVSGDGCPSLWSFESLFPEPVLDEVSIKKDLYGTRERDAKTAAKSAVKRKLDPVSGVLLQSSSAATAPEQPQQQTSKMRSSFYGGPSMMRLWRERRLSSGYLPEVLVPSTERRLNFVDTREAATEPITNGTDALASVIAAATAALGSPVTTTSTSVLPYPDPSKVDRDLTRMVEDRMFGYRRTPDGAYQYDTSLMGDGAIQFRDGVRLGKPLRVNADRLTYLAKKELHHGRVEEAQELYEQAIMIDPQDGRAYLGLSRCAERRKDFTLAREYLRAGVTHSLTPPSKDGLTDRGANPFLLQALGCLEEKMGHLSQAEALYISAAKSRPWHAAAWVALAQLRTRKLGQSAEAGRLLFQAAERELHRTGKGQSSYVYTAWASLEYHIAGDVRRARDLFNSALKVDPKCSAAYLQLGVMEANSGNWKEAQECFDSVLKFDQRNSRALQAYAIMETKRPKGDSRKAIDLFERALKANPRDAGVLQAYALYVAELDDTDSARKLLSRATDVNKRHSAVWQAWGVLEMNEGNPEQARSIFQQGIWACANLAGGQSGGYECARLWQAWGLLESREGDHAAARRCFSRALDADSRNVATVTAWALMEESLDNVKESRYIFERALKQFAPRSEAKKGLWMAYEMMEKRLGNDKEAQRVYQRSMRETLKADVAVPVVGAAAAPVTTSNIEEASTNIDQYSPLNADELTMSPSEVEIVRWDGGSSSMRGEVWMNERAIESKIPTTNKSSNASVKQSRIKKRATIMNANRKR